MPRISHTGLPFPLLSHRRRARCASGAALAQDTHGGCYGDTVRALLVAAAVRYLEKVVDRDTIATIAADARRDGKRVVFTNGCFDLLHVGHVRYLAAARDAGDVLVVGINSDESVRRLKGAQRPLVTETARAEVLAALRGRRLRDDLLRGHARGVDPPPAARRGRERRRLDARDVVGRDIVEARGGRVLIIPTVEGFSTTTLAERIRRST